MAMSGNLASLLGGFLGRTPGAAPMAPRPMIPAMGNQIASIFGAGPRRPGAVGVGSGPNVMPPMPGTAGGQPFAGRGFGGMGVGGGVRPFTGPMANSAGPTLPAKAKAYGARRRFA